MDCIFAYLFYILNVEVDIITALANLITIGFIIIWFKNGYNKIENFYYKILHTKIFLIIISVDLLVHFIPSLILGIAKNKISYLYAYLIILIWYILHYKNIKEIYYDIIEPEWFNYLLIYIV